MAASEIVEEYPADLSGRLASPTAFVGRGWAAFLPLHVVLMGGLALATLTVLWLRLYEPDSVHQIVTLSCGCAVAALIVYARYALGVPWASASLVYLELFWLFHYGFTVSAVLVPSVTRPFQPWDVAWLVWPTTRAAMVLGVLGATAFVGALGIVTLRHRRQRGEPAAPRLHEPMLYAVGWLIMLVGLAASAQALIANGGAALLSLSYLEVRGTLSATSFQTAVNLSQLGCLLALCGAGGRRWMAPLAVWMPLGIVLLLIGLRTEVLIPLVTFAIVLSRRGVRFPRGALVGVALAALVVVPAVRVVRGFGVGNLAMVDWTDVTPLSTFTELGGTLRATSAYVSWIEGGEEMLWGLSYWAPIDRQILDRVIPGREPIPVMSDPRVPARNMGIRGGAIGASSTGEAYYNFGAAGPLIFYGCVGLLFAWLDRRAALSPYGGAVLGVAMLLLDFNLRDQWLPVPGRALAALMVLGGCRAIAWGLHRPTST